jgi:hypothetical protein
MRQHPRIAIQTAQLCGEGRPAGSKTFEATTTLDSCLHSDTPSPPPPFASPIFFLRNSHLSCGTLRVTSLVRTQCLASMPSSSRKQMPRFSERGMIRHRQLRVQQKHRQSSTPKMPTEVWTAGRKAWRRCCTHPEQTSGHLQPSQQSHLTNSPICFLYLRGMKGCA